MSSYNLKAKNKKSGEIEEFEVIPNNDYKKTGTNNVLDSRVFKMEYEVLDNAPVEDWEERFDKQFVVDNGEDVEPVFKDQSDVNLVKQFIREIIQNNDKKGL